MVVNGIVTVERVPEVMSESGTAVGFVDASEKETTGRAEPVAAAAGATVGVEVDGPAAMGGL